MKNKFNAGDKVVYIYSHRNVKYIEVSKNIVGSVLLYKDKIDYFLEDSSDPVDGKNLYTKEEAIEFLKGVL